MRPDQREDRFSQTHSVLPFNKDRDQSMPGVPFITHNVPRRSERSLGLVC